MRRTLHTLAITICLGLAALCPSAHALDDERELTRSIQKDLKALGYEVDNTSGRLTLQTRIAIGAIEEKYGLAATGEPSFDIASKLRAERRAAESNDTAVSQAPCPQTAPPAIAVQEPVPQADAQCLQDKVDAKRSGRAKRIGSAVARLLGRHGNDEVVDTMYEATRTAQEVTETTNDVKVISDELGLTQDEVDACMR